MVPGEPSRRRSGRSHEAFGDGRPRGMAITVPGHCVTGRDRTRLTRRLAPFRLGDLVRPGDGSADQVGISALSRGQPCGLRILSLPVESDRLA